MPLLNTYEDRDEAEKAEKFMDELEKGLGMRRGPQPRDLSPSRNRSRSRSRSRSGLKRLPSRRRTRRN